MPIDDQTLTALTTEHFGLAGARSQAASESASRSALYLGSLSSGLIALGLTAQLPHEKTVFLVGRAINRIRNLYIAESGEAARYFVLSGHDDAAGVVANMGIRPSPWQLFFTAAIAIAVVDSIVGGAAVAVAAGRLGLDAIGLCVGLGGAFAVVCLGVAIWFQKSLRAAEEDEVLFPSPAEERRKVPPSA